MKKLSFLLVIVVLIICAGCSGISAPGGNPQKDAEQFVNEVFEAAKQGDYSKADEIIGVYYDFYSEASLENRILFFKYVNFDELPNEDRRIWYEFMDNPKFENRQNQQKFEILYKRTRAEKQEIGQGL